MRNNRNLLIIVLIALVNMLGYGIIIPILYAYSKKYGLSDFENGLLFSMYSICQFISTPIIGRLSDRYGRRPMLILSIAGTTISFFLMAFAPSAIFLFIARAIDGLTAGNIPVAFAVISDSTKSEDRAKAFGYIWAALNFGFVFGPAISALTVGFGNSLPFIIAAIITLMATLITILYLPETNQHMGEVENKKLIDLPKLWQTLFDPSLGLTFIITFIFFVAFSCALIYGFQPFTLKILKINQTQNAMLFTSFGVIGLLSQTFLIQPISKTLGITKALSTSTFFTMAAFIIMFLSRNLIIFILAMTALGLSNNITQTLLPTVVSRQTDEKSQGSIMGLNVSYQSLGMILGPILGGTVATIAVPLPFLVGSVLVLICFLLSFKIRHLDTYKESAF